MIMESIQDRKASAVEERSSRTYHQMLGRLRHEKKWEETRDKKKGAGSSKKKNYDADKGRIDADKG